METKKVAKVAHFYCNFCDYTTVKKHNWVKHCKTIKHNVSVTGDAGDAKVANVQKQYVCENCANIYSSRNGLWKHKRGCNITNDVQNNISLTTIVHDLVKSNQEIQQQMIELCKTVSVSNTVNNVTNNTINNKSFNLNMFLNHTCKDAMNMKEFIDSIQITLADVESVGELGFVDGISNIIIKNLRAIDYHLRPFHCTDTKRDTVYTKQNDQWVKEDVGLNNFRKFIQLVANKNSKGLDLFKQKHPDYNNYYSKYSDQYDKMVTEAFGGYGNNDHDSEDKIIRKLVKEIAIDKSR